MNRQDWTQEHMCLLYHFLVNPSPGEGTDMGSSGRPSPAPACCPAGSPAGATDPPRAATPARCFVHQSATGRGHLARRSVMEIRWTPAVPPLQTSTSEARSAKVGNFARWGEGGTGNRCIGRGKESLFPVCHLY